jgi:hypothetical protein
MVFQVHLKRYKGQDTMNGTDQGSDALGHDDIVTDCPLSNQDVVRQYATSVNVCTQGSG